MLLMKCRCDGMLSNRGGGGIREAQNQVGAAWRGVECSAISVPRLQDAAVVLFRCACYNCEVSHIQT